MAIKIMLTKVTSGKAGRGTANTGSFCKATSRTSKRGERGNALLECGLIAPILFLFALVAFDAGMYMNSFIAVQSAARAGAIRNSGGLESAVDQAGACSFATNQLQGLPSIASASGSCSAAPLVVTSVLCTGSNACGSASSSADGAPSTLVTVRYTPPFLFGIPLAGPKTITIASQMKVRNIE